MGPVTYVILCERGGLPTQCVCDLQARVRSSDLQRNKHGAKFVWVCVEMETVTLVSLGVAWCAVKHPLHFCRMIACGQDGFCQSVMVDEEEIPNCCIRFSSINVK